ncbi:MAG: hypothetical protein KC422_12070 [Trueperaceae bacterium]|nr:hypothetical protein [Trueperaceae bacterium]
MKRKHYLPLLLFLLGLVYAQNNQANTVASQTRQGDAWFGLTGGLHSSYPFGLALHFGVSNPSGADLRVSGSLQFRDGAASLGIGADGLVTFSEVLPLSIYGGGGGIVFFESESFMIDGHGLLGIEYSLSQQDLEELAVFIEVRIGAALAVGAIPQPSIPAASAVLGFNVYF